MQKLTFLASHSGNRPKCNKKNEKQRNSLQLNQETKLLRPNINGKACTVQELELEDARGRGELAEAAGFGEHQPN